jgi:hypothetical protein
MKTLREYIQKEIKRLSEAIVKRPLPNDAKKTLFDLLNMKPSHIDKIQAIKSIKPSYEITINNGQTFTISDLGNDFGFGLVKISGKEYDILDRSQKNQALTALNDLQTKSIPNVGGGASPEGGAGGEGETLEEPAEEPAEEPEA